MRNPIIKNKYNLTIKDCKHLKIKDRQKIQEPLFWRNDVISAWCICGTSSNQSFICNRFWIGIYDNDAPSYKGKFRFYFTSYDDMCSYDFKKFYDYREIETEEDLKIQEKFLETINMLIDEGILERENCDE